MEERRTALLPRRVDVKRCLKPENQCQYVMRAGIYCGAACILGSDKCKRHHFGGFARGGQGHGTIFGIGTNKIPHSRIEKDFPKSIMPFFKQMCGPKLTKLLDDALLVEEFDIKEEVAIVRASCAEYVEALNALVELKCTDEFAKLDAESKEKINDKIRVVSQCVRNAMNDITFQVERHARIHNMVAEKIHPGAIQDVVRQLNRFVYECFGRNADGTPNMEALMKFDKKLNEELQLPTLKPLAPMASNDDVQAQCDIDAMDATIPVFNESKQLEGNVDATKQSEDGNNA